MSGACSQMNPLILVFFQDVFQSTLVFVKHSYIIADMER